MTLVKFSNSNKGNALNPLFNDVFESICLILNVEFFDIIVVNFFPP